MSEPAAGDAEAPRLSPTMLAPDALARLLTAAGGQRVDVAMIELDIVSGASTNADGTLNLVHYAAWLVRERAPGEKGDSAR